MQKLILVGACLCCCGALLAETPKREVQTPFGPAVVQEDAKQPDSSAKKTPDPSLVKAEAKGDTITFRRKTPFGESVWTRKRSDLTAYEKEILAAQPARTKNETAAAKDQPAAAKSQPAAAKKPPPILPAPATNQGEAVLRQAADANKPVPAAHK